MRSDVRALFRVLGAGALLAVVVMGILALAAFGVLPRNVAVYAAAAVLVVGILVVAGQFARTLVGQHLSREDSDGPDSGRPSRD